MAKFMQTKSRKFVCIAVAVALAVMGLLMPIKAFASTLTITNTLAGKTYNAYIFFEKSGSDFIIKDNSVFKSSFDAFNTAHPGMFTVTDISATEHKVVPTASFDEDAAALLAETAMTNYSTWKDSYIATKIATTDTVVFDGIQDGYYLVKSSAGTVLSMVTVDGTGTINEKNTEGRYVELQYDVEREAVGY